MCILQLLHGNKEFNVDVLEAMHYTYTTLYLEIWHCVPQSVSKACQGYPEEFVLALKKGLRPVPEITLPELEAAVEASLNTLMT